VACSSKGKRCPAVVAHDLAFVLRLRCEACALRRRSNADREGAQAAAIDESMQAVSFSNAFCARAVAAQAASRASRSSRVEAHLLTPPTSGSLVRPSASEKARRSGAWGR
jgi:hypothetical protein